MMTSSSVLIYGLIMVFGAVVKVAARARLIEPTMRSSLWRLGGLDVPVNFKDELLNCGGFDEQWLKADGRCGVCGDPYLASHKQNEYPGLHSRQEPVKTIHRRDLLNVTVYSKPNLLGYFEFRLCPHKEPSLEECFNSNPLLVIDETNSTRYFTGNGRQYFDMHLRMPNGLTCDHCVLQWKYTTGYRMGIDYAACRECQGCGSQETFINCADIRILEDTDDDPFNWKPHTSPDDSLNVNKHLTIDNRDNGGSDVVYAYPVVRPLFIPYQMPKRTHSYANRTAKRKPHNYAYMPYASFSFIPMQKPKALTSSIANTHLIKVETSTLTSSSTSSSPAPPTTTATRKSLVFTTSVSERTSPCNKQHGGIICGPLKSNQLSKGMFNYCARHCQPGSCAVQACACWCQYLNGTRIPFPDHVGAGALTVKWMCYVGNKTWRLVPGIDWWCQLNCPGSECRQICVKSVCSS